MGSHLHRSLSKLLMETTQSLFLVVGATGKIFDISTRCAGLLGMSKMALRGRDFKSFITGDIDKIFHNHVGLVELKLVTANRDCKSYLARLFPLKRGRLRSLVLIEFREPGTKMNLEDELQMERDRLETIINSMGDGLGIVDENYNVRFMNKALMDLTGKKAIGKSCYKAYAGNDYPCENCPLKGGIDHLDTNTVEVTGANGRTFLITHSPIKDAAGKTAILEILKDITTSKKLEKRLLESERRAILSTFSSAITHDLRNSIIGINKAHQLLLNSYENLGKACLNRWLSDLSTSSELLLGLLDDMLDIFQKGYTNLKLQKSFFNFNEVVPKVLSLFNASAEEKNIWVKFHPSKKESVIFGDRRRLQRVIINVLDNAIKFSPKGGSIFLKSKLIYLDRSTPVYLSFCIEDQGPGVDPKHINSIFEMNPRKGGNISTTHGVGMGLHFCKIIVEAHKGRISVVNKKNGGSLFKVILPLKE